MVHIEHHTVGEHQRCIKYVEKGFVVIQVAIVPLEYLDGTEDVADENQSTA